MLSSDAGEIFKTAFSRQAFLFFYRQVLSHRVIIYSQRGFQYAYV
jgi:hypothetical protein